MKQSCFSYLCLVMLNCILPQMHPEVSHSDHCDTSQSIGQSMGHPASRTSGLLKPWHRSSETGLLSRERTQRAPLRRTPGPQASPWRGRQLDQAVSAHSCRLNSQEPLKNDKSICICTLLLVDLGLPPKAVRKIISKIPGSSSQWIDTQTERA